MDFEMCSRRREENDRSVRGWEEEKAAFERN